MNLNLIKELGKLCKREVSIKKKLRWIDNTEYKGDCHRIHRMVCYMIGLMGDVSRRKIKDIILGHLAQENDTLWMEMRRLSSLDYEEHHAVLFMKVSNKILSNSEIIAKMESDLQMVAVYAPSPSIMTKRMFDRIKKALKEMLEVRQSTNHSKMMHIISQVREER